MSNSSEVETAATEPASASTVDTAHAEDMKKHIRIYIAVFAALGVLTVLTVVVGYVELPIVPALIVGLLIAGVKGGLVAGYFMHLISEEKVIYWVLGITAVFLLGLILLTVFSFYDQSGQALVP